MNKVDNIPKNLTSGEWNRIYDHLYGGFEDIGDEDSEESDDEDEGLPKTKSGYMKDDFIVDDDDDGDESYDSEISIPKTKKRNIPPKTPRRNKAPTVFNISDSEDSEYTNELEEEEYL